MAKSQRNSREGDSGLQEHDSDSRGAPEDSNRENKASQHDSNEIELDDWQKEILECTDRRILLCKGRQVGGTTIMARKCADRLLKQKNCKIVVVSLTEDQAQLVIIMILDYLEKHFRTWIKRPYSKNVTKGKIVLTNGSEVISRPVGNTGDAVRGFTGNVLYINEASRMNQVIFEAAKPILLTTKGDIWMDSTPFGKKGYFYECFLNKSGAWKIFYVSSEDVIRNRKTNDIFTEERKEAALKFLEDEKMEMSKVQYAQEYMGKFIDDLRQLFSDELISKVCVLKRPETIIQGRDYYMGVDIARLGEDETTFEILDRVTSNHIEQVNSIVKRKQLTTETYQNIIDLNRIYKLKKIGIDAGAGSLGVGIFDFLLKVPDIKLKVVAINNLARNLDSHGDKKKTLMKEDLYNNLLMMMERGMIQLLDDDEIRLSLKSVQYEYIMERDEPTRLRIFGSYTHIAEGLTRAAWLSNQKSLNLRISYV